MTLDTIKRWFFENALKGQKFVSVKSSGEKQIGIFYHDKPESEKASFERYLSNHQQKHSQINTLIYKNEKSEAKVPGFYFINNLGWNGIPNSESITSFLSKEYDVFYFLVEETLDLHHEFLLRKINAKFKIGLFQPGLESFFDLMLDIKAHDLLSQIKQIDQTIENLKLK